MSGRKVAVQPIVSIYNLRTDHHQFRYASKRLGSMYADDKLLDLIERHLQASANRMYVLPPVL